MDVSEALAGTNPNYSKGREYQINCQRCAQAYEMRRRGYDVEALPHYKGVSPGFWGNECFVDSTGNTPSFTYWQTAAQIQSELANAPDGARYIIYVVWENGDAHVFNAEKTGGAVSYVDGQVNDGDVSRYLSLGADGEFGYLRVDDKRLTNDTTVLDETVK